MTAPWAHTSRGRPARRASDAAGRNVPAVDDASSGGVDELLAAARAAQANSYSPYSRFPVGAAIRSGSGRVYAGANYENAAYPQGVCAEGTAIGAMITAGERVIVEVLTVADGDHLTTCCGGCRQKLREFANPDVLVHAAGPEGVRRTFTLGELLPASFGPDQLDR